MRPELQGPINKVHILSELSPPAIIAGFVLKKLNVVSPDAQVSVRADSRVYPELLGSTVPLFRVHNKDYLNPGELLKLISNSGDRISRHERASLRQLVLAIEPYRRFPEDEWWRIGSAPGVKLEHRYLYQLLVWDILHHFNEGPDKGYTRALNSLDKFFPFHPDKFLETMQRVTRRANYGDLPEIINKPIERPLVPYFPIKLKVPKHKSQDEDEPDRVEIAEFEFNRGRIRLLAKINYAIMIGGSPHSGKSTAAVSFYYETKRLIIQAENNGIINPGDVRVGLVDLDLPSPTVQAIMDEEKPIRDPKIHWTQDFVEQGLDNMSQALKNNNIVFADMPGGPPDSITNSLARRGDYSILIEKGRGVESRPWRDYLLGADLPAFLIHARTRIAESGRISGIRNYESRSRGDNFDRLRGRIVNLKRRPIPDDNFISFATAVLLYDYLPSSIIRREVYRANLLASIRS